MNILLSINEKYLDKALVTMSSLIRRNKEEINIFILQNGIKEQSQEDFKKQIAKMSKRASVNFITISPDFFKGFPLGRFALETYYRVICQFVLPEDIDRILYLDVDIVVRKSLSSFYYQDFDGGGEVYGRLCC